MSRDEKPTTNPTFRARPRAYRDPAVTYRQLEVLAWVQEGKSAPDIGIILGISTRTVEWHLLRVCEILGVKTRLQAVIKVRDLGLLHDGPPS